MTEALRKRCVVAWALRDRQFLWEVDLPAQASVADALEAARSAAGSGVEVPWATADVGIFGEPCSRLAIPRDGDRIEIYRPLRIDPRMERRARVQRLRGGRGR